MTKQGHPPQEVLLDAKVSSRAIAFADQADPGWSKRISRMIEQAEVQLAALSDSARRAWHVSDPYAADTVRRLLRGAGVHGDDLTVVFAPMRTE